MKSEIELQDEYIQLGQRDSFTFLEIQNTREYDDSNKEDPTLMAQLYIRLDSNYLQYERKIYSLFELLRDIGGLQRSVFVLGLILVNLISYRVFISQMIKKLYYIKNSKPAAALKKSGRE